MFSQDTKVNVYNPLGSFDDLFRLKYDTGYDIDAIGGYDFGNFRLEGEVAHKHAGLDSIHERLTDTTFDARSEEHTSELQSLMRISYAVFCLKKKNNTNKS